MHNMLLKHKILTINRGNVHIKH